MNVSLLKIYKNIGIDLGTANTLLCKANGEIVLSEPTVVALDKTTKKVLAVGDEANDMLGRTPDNIVAVCPVQNGVIADFESASAMVKVFIKRILGSFSVIKPIISVSVPSGITEVERKATIEALMMAGARQVVLIEEIVASAIGAGLPVLAPQGTMIVNIGAGTTEVAVLSLGGIVASRSIRTGGKRIDDAIIGHLRRNYGVTIGSKTAEEIKIEIASLAKSDKNDVYDVKGRETSTGLPKNVRISSNEIQDAISDIIRDIVDAVLDTLEDIHPELASDILSQGIVLSGAGALIRGIDEVIEKATGIRTWICDNPAEAAAIGIGAVFSMPEVIRRSEVTRKR